MTVLLFIGGLVAFLYLQGRVRTLEWRLQLLEAGGLAPAATSETWPAAAPPAPVESPEPVAAPPEPAPEPVVADVAEVEAPVLPTAEYEPWQPEPAIEEQAAPARLTFEDMFGRKLPIWAGGVTLAIAGFLIVKYSIDTGLLSPAIRVLFGMLFGFGLIGGAEWARRERERVSDPRVAQALAGAGVATLYGSVLIAGNLYGLIGPATAFVGLAAVTALALVLAPVFGAPSALLGLVGGFAAPLFVGSDEPNVPLLTIYLGLTIGGLAAVARGQRWPWLGYAAMAGGFLWSATLIATAPVSASTSVSIGLFLLLVGLALPAQAIKGFSPARAAIGASVAALQVAAMVARGGFAPLDWALFGLISIGLQWIARRDAALGPLRALGFGIALLLLAAWPTPPVNDFGFALGAMLLIYGGPALFDLWRERGGLIEAGQICAAALAVWLLPLFHFHAPNGPDLPYALLALGGAAFAAGAAALGRRHEARRTDFRFVALVAAAALSAAGAVVIAAPFWLVAPLLGLVAAIVLAVALLGDDRWTEIVAWVGLAATVAAVLVTCGEALPHAFGIGAGAEWRMTVALSLVTAIAAGFAWLGRIREAGWAAQVAAALLGYVALGQLVAVRFEPVLAAGMLAGLAIGGRRVLPALLVLALVALAWAAEPIAVWSLGALQSLVGVPLLVTALPRMQDMLLQLAVPALALGVASLLTRMRWPVMAVPGALLLVAGHVAYKQLFAIVGPNGFETFGFAERTLWEALLIGAGVVLARRRAGLVLLGLGLAHFGLYSLLLHNPLWWPQAVGPLPLLNLLVPAYGLAMVALWLVGRELPALARVAEIARMVLILLLGWSLLRQAFHGSFLVGGGVSGAEDIARSIAILGAGVGFLVWGIWQGGRDWRVASLVLMLAAAGKVFLLDAAGLEGLLRIGAFVALGFSLIGIGWLYAKFVGKPGLTAQP